MNNLEKIIEDFNRIKSLGYVKSSRPNNKDGGIGNTYEDLVGIKENNICLPDYLGFEVKSKREFNSSYVSLFSKSLTSPKGANSLLRERYGEIRDLNFNRKKLYASVFGHRFSLIYNKYKMKLKVDYKEEKIFLNIFNLKSKLIDSVNWSFNDLKKSSEKIKSLILITASEKEIDGITYYHYNNAEIFSKFNFDNFLRNVEKGGIMFDLRIGVYNSGKSIGKTHDHGSGFRIKSDNFKNIYDQYLKL